MKILDKFILKSFFWPFLVAFLLVTFILMMQFLWLYIDELVGKGLSMGIIIEFLAWGCCTLIPMALPLATLFSSIMAMGNMGENNELLAMKSAGISLQRILTPLIFVAVLISIGAFFASNNLIPLAWNKICTLRDDIANTKSEIKIPTGAFYNGIDGYTLLVGSRDNNNMMHNIMVYDHSANKGNVNVTIADSGMIEMTVNKKNLIFTLFNGTNYVDDNNVSYSDTTLTLQNVTFSRQEIVIPLEHYAFQKSSDSKYDDQVMAKNLHQLSIDRDSLLAEYNSMLKMKTVSVISSVNFMHCEGLDTTLNKSTPYRIASDSLLQWNDIELKNRAYQRAADVATEYLSNCTFYEKELYQYGYPYRKTVTEAFRKFTLSLACLIFFFIGAPLGAIIRKGGLGTPVIISMFFFLIYYVIDISGKKLAYDGAVLPILGTFISSIVLLPIGIMLTIKSTRDSNLFNADAYKNFFKTLFNFIANPLSLLKKRKAEN